MHLFSDKKPEPGLKPAAASGTPQLTEEEKEQSRVQKLQQKKDASQQIAQAKATVYIYFDDDRILFFSWSV